MKSIMQEASSIAKAIELGWIKAGQPNEFSVKILEEPERGMFGITTKRNAKIAFFFKETALKKATRSTSRKPRRSESTQEKRAERPAPRAQQQEHVRKPTRKETTPTPTAPTAPQPQEKPQRERAALWTDEMLDASKKWVATSLKALNRHDVSFDTSVNRYFMKVTFNKPVLENSDQQRKLFSGFSFLLLQALRNQTKKPLSKHKIILTCNE